MEDLRKGKARDMRIGKEEVEKKKVEYSSTHRIGKRSLTEIFIFLSIVNHWIGWVNLKTLFYTNAKINNQGLYIY